MIERTMAGKRSIAREGKWHGGGLPYGYGVVGGFLLPRESEASVVREWCRRVAAGSTLVAERNRLHAEGITPKRGGRQWHQARRRAIEVLLQEVKVRTIGNGRQEKAEVTFHCLGQDPYVHLDVSDLRDTTMDADILNDSDVIEDSGPRGIVWRPI